VVKCLLGDICQLIVGKFVYYSKTFFEKRGYKVIKEQQVVRKGIYLTNYLMEKKYYKK
jgi:putative acetyltransferase